MRAARPAALALALGFAHVPGAALPLEMGLPETAVLAAEVASDRAVTEIPVGNHDGATVPMIPAEGAVKRRAWQFPRKGQTTLQVLEPLRARLLDQGFQVIHQCDAAACGGFDFRFATDTLPEPAMHVDLGDFQFLSARRLAADGPEYVCLMVSRSANRAFVQVTRVGGERAAGAPVASSTKSGAASADLAPGTPLADRLELDGRAVLEDVDFATGSAALAEGGSASLAALAAYLRANPGRAVMLVGHTDAVGALDANIALSRKRAQAVRDHLVGRLEVPSAQVAAEGAGFLAPRASNRTEDGRTRNRRVEAILTTVD